MRYLLLASVLVLAHCVQSTAIVDPVTNKASVGSTAATQGTVTLSIDLSALISATAVLNNQGFSALLFQNGVIKAALNQGTGTTDASGKATTLMRGVDASMAMTATTATLTNGVYDFYFAANNNAVATFTAYGGACNTAGFMDANTNGGTYFIYGSRDQVTVSGNKTLSLNISNVSPSKSHTFQFSGTSPFSKPAACFVTDANASSVASTYYLAKFSGTTNGSGNLSTTVDACGNTIYLPPGVYKYFCYIDAGGTASFFDSGTDKIATGTTNITGGATTYLTSTSFTTVP
jgi:hypothetical protein